MAELPNVGKAIRQALVGQGKTQRQMARDLKLSEVHVSQVVTGKVRGDWSTVNHMLSYVGLKLTITQENNDD